jgi:hypothetical protein
MNAQQIQQYQILRHLLPAGFQQFGNEFMMQQQRRAQRAYSPSNQPIRGLPEIDMLPSRELPSEPFVGKGAENAPSIADTLNQQRVTSVQDTEYQTALAEAQELQRWQGVPGRLESSNEAEMARQAMLQRNAAADRAANPEKYAAPSANPFQVIGDIVNQLGTIPENLGNLIGNNMDSESAVGKLLQGVDSMNPKNLLTVPKPTDASRFVEENGQFVQPGQPGVVGQPITPGQPGQPNQTTQPGQSVQPVQGSNSQSQFERNKQAEIAQMLAGMRDLQIGGRVRKAPDMMGTLYQRTAEQRAQQEELLKRQGPAPLPYNPGEVTERNARIRAENAQDYGQSPQFTYTGGMPADNQVRNMFAQRKNQLGTTVFGVPVAGNQMDFINDYQRRRASLGGGLDADIPAQWAALQAWMGGPQQRRIPQTQL